MCVCVWVLVSVKTACVCSRSHGSLLFYTDKSDCLNLWITARVRESALEMQRQLKRQYVHARLVVGVVCFSPVNTAQRLFTWGPFLKAGFPNLELEANPETRRFRCWFHVQKQLV